MSLLIILPTSERLRERSPSIRTVPLERVGKERIIESPIPKAKAKRRCVVLIRILHPLRKVFVTYEFFLLA
jgi:hypothetical protein